VETGIERVDGAQEDARDMDGPREFGGMLKASEPDMEVEVEDGGGTEERSRLAACWAMSLLASLCWTRCKPLVR
jgi:hypothetical protein